MDLQTKVFLIVLILAILKDIIVYSVGRSHNIKEFDFYMPTPMEWLTIIILITILYWIGERILLRVIN